MSSHCVPNLHGPEHPRVPVYAVAQDCSEVNGAVAIGAIEVRACCRRASGGQRGR
jgi:hypothetical protein